MKDTSNDSNLRYIYIYIIIIDSLSLRHGCAASLILSVRLDLSLASLLKTLSLPLRTLDTLPFARSPAQKLDCLVLASRALHVATRYYYENHPPAPGLLTMYVTLVSNPVALMLLY